LIEALRSTADRVSGKATIYDVADHAGVSISTVSLAINAPGRVRPATLERVLTAVDALDYMPRSAAVTRARRGVGRVGVLAPFTSARSFGRLLNGVLRAARGHPFEVVVFDAGGGATPELLEPPLAPRIDGLIAMSIPLGRERATQLAAQGVAAVVVECEDPYVTSVTVDNVAGGRMVAELLLARGHRRFGFLAPLPSPRDVVRHSDARLTGFRAGLGAAGVELADADVRLVEHTFEAARAATTDLLAAHDRPTAIFAASDLLAGGALAAARDRGLRVPHDVALVGFDDDEIATALGLTSVRQPLEESGDAAMQALLALLAQPRRPIHHTRLGLTLVERAST
jgi:DNA-binding LacI/PurR family transcriptional regulator